jgi:hypothetical protein
MRDPGRKKIRIRDEHISENLVLGTAVPVTIFFRIRDLLDPGSGKEKIRSGTQVLDHKKNKRVTGYFFKNKT